jgi:dipeptidyl-peptidase-4
VVVGEVRLQAPLPLRRRGKLIAQITTGDWPVNALEGVDEARKVAIFSASIDTPLERRIYEVSYASPGKNGKPKALTPAGGWWTANVAETGGAFTAGYSDPKTPPRMALYDASRQARALDRGEQARRQPSLRALRRHPARP